MALSSETSALRGSKVCRTSMNCACMHLVLVHRFMYLSVLSCMDGDSLHWWCMYTVFHFGHIFASTGWF